MSKVKTGSSGHTRLKGYSVKSYLSSLHVKSRRHSETQHLHVESGLIHKVA